MISVGASTGIYKIEHTNSGRVYIGSAIDLNKRWSHHKWSLRKRNHANSMLQNAWNKYGESAFKFIPLLVCSKENRVFYEQLVMDGLSSHERKFGFNIRKKAESNTGLKLSKEHKSAISARTRGIPIKNKAGDKYGTVTLVKFIGIKKRHHVWWLKCDCGREYTASVDWLRSGKQKSCGCLPRPRKNSRFMGHSMYHDWARAAPRSYEWKDYSKFLLDVGEKPEGYFIDRPNKEVPFSKDNFVWLPYGTTARCRMINLNGECMNFSKACRSLGINPSSGGNWVHNNKKTHQQAIDYYVRKKEMFL